RVRGKLEKLFEDDRSETRRLGYRRRQKTLSRRTGRKDIFGHRLRLWPALVCRIVAWRSIRPGDRYRRELGQHYTHTAWRPSARLEVGRENRFNLRCIGR